MKKKILLIEDNDATRFGFVRYFSMEGYSVCEAADLADAEEALATQNFDAIVLDNTLPDGSGIDFITSVRASDPNIPIIVITGSANIPLAVEAMRRGADNFLTKPVDNVGLALFLRKTLETSDLKRQHANRKRLEPKEDIFFGESPAMQEVLQLARTVASSDSPVLITGETGTGKGMLTKWIHRNSKRSRNEFVEVNCSGLRGELLARELFGNARGAFTSANEDRKGLLDIADQSTLFLDEIGDMGMDVQAQFLKVLEDKKYRRLGDVKQLKSDFRLVCATNREIESLVRTGLFRRDLLYRINLLVIHIPPLRERLGDLPAIAVYLLNELGFSETVVPDDVTRMLMAYTWPGNIRELKNVLERALLFTPRGEPLCPSHFCNLGIGREAPNFPVHSCTAQEVEEAHIKKVLKQVGGDIKKAANSLNISRATLYRRLKRISDHSQPVLNKVWSF